MFGSRRVPKSLHQFKTSVRPVAISRVRAGGPGQALLADENRNHWLVEFDSKDLKAPPTVVEGTLDLGDEGNAEQYLDLVGDRIMVDCERGGREWTEVQDFRKGAFVFATANAGGALTLDGRYLLLLDENGIDIADMRTPAKVLHRSGLFPWHAASLEPVLPEGVEKDAGTLDMPCSAMAVPSSNDGSTYTLAIGDYGFAIVGEIRIDETDERTSTRLVSAQSFTDLVFDPVEVVDLIPGSSVVVIHGHGAGLAGFDLETREKNDCPRPPAKPDPRYSIFRRVVASSRLGEYWVDTDTGPHYWDGKDDFRELSPEASSVIATNGKDFLGLSSDGRELIRGRF